MKPSVASGDAQGNAFAVIDKMAATVSLYDDTEKLMAVSPVSVGAAQRDNSVPSIGTRPMAAMAPHEHVLPETKTAREWFAFLQ